MSSRGLLGVENDGVHSVSAADRRSAFVRSALAFVVLLGATAWFAKFLNGVQPVREWLFVELAKIWGWELLLSVACASFGHLLLVRVFRMGELPSLEKLALSFPLGLIAFVLFIYLGGFVHVLRPTYGVLLPTTMLVVSIPATRRVLAGLRGPAFATTPVATLVTAFGALGVGLLYLEVFSPDSLNYDSTWNHLVIAQDYAREGRIVPFPGDWVKNVPHLGSVVNTWAFLVPGFERPALRWMMALHDEFVVFLWTLVGVAAASRYLSERASLRAGWVAVFLFPGLFVYDGNMGSAGDHFLALFAVPVFIASARFIERLDVRRGALLGVFAGAGLLTKYHVVYLLVPIAVVISAKLVSLVVAHLRGSADVPAPRRVALALGATIGCALLVLSVHFGSNWVFFHNPFFPLAQGSIRSVPYLPDAQLQMDNLFADYRWHPPKVLSERVRKALGMVFTFSFEPHYTFTGDKPTFGSLLTLLFPAVFLVGVARRLWFGMAVCMGALFVWAMTFWVDRNLQTFLPLMAAVVAAAIGRLWELGALARVGVAAVVGLQVVWGGDYYFSGSDRITSALTLIRSGMDGHATTRFDAYRKDYVDIGKALPGNAVVLLHDQHVMLGIDHPVLLDWVGFQGLVDYRTFRTPRDVYDRFKALGVTHVLWTPGNRAAAYRQEEILFDLFAYPLLEKATVFGGLRLAAMPSEPPPSEGHSELEVVLWKVSQYADGTYPVSGLDACEEMPAELQHFRPPKRRLEAKDLGDALGGAGAAIIGDDPSGLDASAVLALVEHFFVAQRTGTMTVYGRNRPPADGSAR